jgi:hypothetical protein
MLTAKNSSQRMIGETAPPKATKDVSRLARPRFFPESMVLFAITESVSDFVIDKRAHEAMFFHSSAAATSG